MKSKQTEALLSKVMGWRDDNLILERFYIEMMADLKYDEYQQYSQGMRFVENLTQWLDRISPDDRSELY